MNDEKEVIEFWKFLEILQTKKFNPQKDEKENKSRKCKVLKILIQKKIILLQLRLMKNGRIL
ncbi:hypothetical protein [Treponema sp. Marseille-Q4130]|uniref:hypothetical protein n=1 Tax=Treponema sp. Marseille-Q4130 TaxID=2766702 RepID=UPI00165244BF|nr:hypothetical protein [Treponema sp. Marseille-Q4130]MBC6719319.1 hypothetical protein [Treponema sp. Marseille-Q4130]